MILKLHLARSRKQSGPFLYSSSLQPSFRRILRCHIELREYLFGNSGTHGRFAGEPDSLCVHCLRVLGSNCHWRLDSVRPDEYPPSHLVRRCFRFHCCLHTAFRKRDSCYHNSACYWILDFRHISLDLHRIVTLLGLHRSAIWTVFWSSFLGPDNRRFDPRLGQWIRLPILELRSVIRQCSDPCFDRECLGSILD